MEQTHRLTYGFVAKAAVVVIAVWALAQGLWLVRDVLFIAFAAALLAVFFSLLVDRLDPVMPRWLAGLITLVVFLGLIVGFWVVVWPRVQSQLTTVADQLPRTLGSAVDWIRQQWDQLLPAATADGTVTSTAAGQTEGSFQARLRTEAVNMVSGALPLLNTAIGAVTGVIITIFAAVFLVIAPSTYVDGLLRLVPQNGRQRLRRALEDAGSALKRWIAGMSVSMTVIFLMSTAGLYLLGVPGALVLGMIAGILVFIPFVGPTLSAIPAMAMGLTDSPMMLLWVAILYLGIQLLESNFLTPVIMKEAVELEPAAIILFQMAMGVLFGFLGLFLAVPLFAVLQVMVAELYVEEMDGAEGSADG